MKSITTTTDGSTPARDDQWTVLNLIQWSADYLASKNVDSPRLTAELLLSHSLGCSRVHLYTHFDKPLSRDELQSYKALFKRRLAREPLQYIIGETGFMGLTFHVDRRALIPRPETEVLVEHAIDLLKRSEVTHPRILDIGTGTGVIAIALARRFEKATVDASDRDAGALALADENARLLGVEDRVNFHLLDIQETFGVPPNAPYDLVLSNPPYISLQEYDRLEPEIKEHEPRHALTDGVDGLSFFRSIVSNGMGLLADRGHLAVEIACDQGDVVQSFFRNGGFEDISLILDYDGNARVVSGTKGER